MNDEPKTDRDFRKLLLGGMTATCVFEKGAKSGFMHMTIEGATVSRGDKELGTVRPIIGGGMEVRIDDYTYSISLQEIWTAVAEAHEKWAKEKTG